MGNAPTILEEESVLASQLNNTSKSSFSTDQINPYYLLMLEEQSAGVKVKVPGVRHPLTCALHRTSSTCSSESLGGVKVKVPGVRHPLTCALHRTSSTCSSESLGDSPRKRRIPYVGVTARMVSRLKNRSARISPVDAFICYSRSDGLSVAKSLADKLKDCDYRVKMDTKSKPSSCNEAINTAKYAIVILSPGFFQDKHAMCTLEKLTGRQMNGGERFILPLWHEVDERQVFQSWPQMTDIFGLKTSIGLPAIVKEFRNKIIHGSNMCHRVCQV